MHTREKIGKFWGLSLLRYKGIYQRQKRPQPNARARTRKRSERGGAQMVATAAAVNHHQGGLFFRPFFSAADGWRAPAVLTGCKPGTSPHAIGRTRKRGSKARPRIMRARFGQTLHEGCKAHARAKAVF